MAKQNSACLTSREAPELCLKAPQTTMSLQKCIFLHKVVQNQSLKIYKCSLFKLTFYLHKLTLQARLSVRVGVCTQIDHFAIKISNLAVTSTSIFFQNHKSLDYSQESQKQNSLRAERHQRIGKGNVHMSGCEKSVSFQQPVQYQ